MSRTYYVIELTPRWLGILLVVLAALMVLAFVGGYGAAWSVLGSGDEGSPTVAGVAPTPTAATVDIRARPNAAVVPSRATPVPVRPTVTPQPAVRTPTPAVPTPTAAPPADTPVVSPSPASGLTPLPVSGGFWVQVLASGNREAIETARAKLVEAGFPRTNQKVVETTVAGDTRLLKLRIGPFPDRDSADRVAARMQGAGFPDAWVVKP